MSDDVIVIEDNIELKYEILEDKSVKLLNEKTAGIVVKYGGVKFEETSDGFLKIKYDYDVLEHNSKKYHKKAFEKYLGRILTEIIEYEHRNERVVFKGGNVEVE